MVTVYQNCFILKITYSKKKEEAEIDEVGEDNAKLVEFCENELRLTEQCLIANPKSYGSWHHRYWVLSNHPKANWQREFDLCNKYLSADDRNCRYYFYKCLTG